MLWFHLQHRESADVGEIHLALLDRQMVWSSPCWLSPKGDCQSNYSLAPVHWGGGWIAYLGQNMKPTMTLVCLCVDKLGNRIRYL